MPSVSIENYLKAIWSLQQASVRVKTKALADRLEVSPPSATQMLRNLENLGFVSYQPYQGASLTEEGTRTALKVIRKHRLVEAFLVATLGYSWDEVHDEAELLEHAVSDELVNRIDAFLSHPEFDPHGDPIPTAMGTIRHHGAGTLADLPDGQSARILRVLDQEPDVLRYLNERGLVPGAKVTVRTREPFDGPLVVEIDGQAHVLASALASELIALREPPQTA